MKNTVITSLFLLLFCASWAISADVGTYSTFEQAFENSTSEINLISNITFNNNGDPEWSGGSSTGTKTINGLNNGNRFELIGVGGAGLEIRNRAANYYFKVLSINNVIIRNMNSSDGAVYLNSRNNYSSDIYLNLYNTDFYNNNRAINTNNGGSNRSIVINATGSIVMSNNSVSGSGGAMNLVDRTTATFTNSNATFSANRATGNNSSGGAIYMTGRYSSLSFLNSFVTFSGNQSYGGGGAIDLIGTASGGPTFNIKNNSHVIFENNETTNDAGGALHSHYSLTDISGSTVIFRGNRSYANAGAADIYNRSTFTVSGSYVLFEDNTAGSSGGAIYTGEGSLLNFDNSTVIFSSNTAALNGGAISSNDDNTRATFTSSIVTFSSNTSKSVGGGGAVFLGAGSNSYMNFINSNVTFSGNKAESGGSGGAVSIISSNMNFTGGNILFQSNSAANKGGGIFLNTASSITFSGNQSVEFLNNEASVGGAVYAAAGSSISFSNVRSLEFIGNYSFGNGGAVYLERIAIADFSGSNLIAKENSAGNGGFLYSETNSNIKFGNVWLESNTARANGGAIYAGSETQLVFSGVGADIHRNSSTVNGGAIFLDGAAVANFTETALRAFENKAANGGFLYLAGSGIANFGSVWLESNTATGNGGAIYAGTGSRLVFSGSTTVISNNTADLNGGAIYLAGSVTANFINTYLHAYGNRALNGGFLFINSGTSMFGSVLLESNTATGNGGAISAGSGSNLLFLGANSTISNNTAHQNGGAIYLARTATANFENTYLLANDNKAVDGGFLYSAGGSATFGTADLINNTASRNGGAIYAEPGSNLTFSSTTVNISYNHAGESGGAIYASNAGVNFTSTILRASSNTAVIGGFLYSENSQNLNFANVYLNGNTSSGDGGAFYLKNSHAYFSGSAMDFNSNRATGNTSRGGVFFLDGSTVTFTNASAIFLNNSAASGGAMYLMSGSSASFRNKTTDFSNNKAHHGSGGAIYAAGTNTLLSFSGETVEFFHNSATNDGGAVYLNSGAKASFGSYSSFVNNSAVNGGAFAVSGAGTSLNFSTGTSIIFSNNTASANGGALYLNSNAKAVLNSNGLLEFTNNTSHQNGGAVYVAGGSNIEFNNAVFAGNTASGLGGALYAEGSQASVSTVVFNTSYGKQSEFSGNKAGGISNAVYAGSYSEIYFNTAFGGNVEMRDGIAGSADNAAMIFSGGGNFNLYANSVYNYADIIIRSGNFNIKEGANLSARDFTNDARSVFSMKDGHASTLTVNNFYSYGRLNMDIFANEGSDQIKSGGNVTLSSVTSVLNVTMDSSDTNFRKKIYKLIYYGGDLNVKFSSVIVDGISLSSNPKINYGDFVDNWITLTLFGDRMTTDFGKLKGLSFNQKQTAMVYDIFSENSSGDLDIIISLVESEGDAKSQRRALSQASGYFLSNVIRSGGSSGGSNEIYARINKEEHDLGDKGIWVQGKINTVSNKGDDNSPEDYSDTTIGAAVGYDMLISNKNLILGVYGKFNKHDISQDPGNTADVVNAGLGVYGGYVKSGWEIKALLSGSVDNYSTERNISFAGRKAKADFSGMTINADIEGALKMELNEKTKLKYYAGLEVLNSNYDEIKESGAQSLSLTVYSDSYQRMSGRVGLGIDQNRDVFDWYVNAEYKLLLEGNLPEIEGMFEGTDIIFKSKGSEEGKGIIGAKAGGSVNVTGNLKLFANTALYTADKYQNIYGSLGVKWFFQSPAFSKADKDRKEAASRLKKEAKAIKEREKKLNDEIKAYEKAIKSAEKEKQKAENEFIEKEKQEKLLEAKAAKKEADEKAKMEKEQQKLLDGKILSYEELKIKSEKEKADFERKQAKIEQKEIAAALKEADKKAKAEIKKAKEEEKQIDAEIAAYEKARVKAEKAQKKAESVKEEENEKIKTAVPVPVARVQEERKAADARILEFEIMLAAEQKKEEARIKAERDKEKEDELRQMQFAQAKLEEERKKRTSGEISDEELAIRKKEAENRMLKPILESFEIKFMSNKYELTPHWKIELKKQSEAIKKYKYKKILIEGHADSVEGTPKKLSRLRAKAVYDEFVNNGIPAEKITYVGLSSVLPAASNNSEAGRMANRRVVVVIE